MFWKQWICTILFANIFARGRGVLWLQVHYFYFDKVLLYKQEKTHSEYFHPAFIGLIIFISSNFGGSQILFDFAKSNLVLVGILKFRCAMSHSQKFLWLPLPSHGNNTAIYGAFPWTHPISIPPENHAILSPQIPRSPGDKQWRVLWSLVTTEIKSSNVLFPFLIKG